MNLDWMMSPLAVYGVVCSLAVAFLYLVLSTQVELQRQATAHQAGRRAFEQELASLTGKLDELLSGVQDRPSQGAPAASINMHKRALALRLYQKGADPHTITAAAGLPVAEMALLGKVHLILSGASELHQDVALRA